MAYVIEILRQEHRNIEKLLRVLEQELNVFSRGERPDYEVVLAAIDYFKAYPDACHHPKEDMIFERLRVIFLTSERPPLYALSLGHFELAALCEFLGRTKRRKALASTHGARASLPERPRPQPVGSVGRSQFCIDRVPCSPAPPFQATNTGLTGGGTRLRAIGIT
jgi:hypothetical protein